MQYETERKFLLPPGSALEGTGLTMQLVEGTQDMRLQPLTRLVDQAGAGLRAVRRERVASWHVIGDMYFRPASEGYAPLRIRHMITSAGHVSVKACVKIPTDRADTRLELEYVMGEGRGPGRVPRFDSEESCAGYVIKGRMLGGIIEGAQVWIDIYALPAAGAGPDDLSRAVQEVWDEQMLDRLHHFSPAVRYKAAGVKGRGVRRYFDAIIIAEVEGSPDAVRGYNAPSTWIELTGKKDWGASSIAMRGWPQLATL